VAQNYRMQEKLANVIIDADTLRRTYKRSWFLALSKHAPLRHRAQNMLDSPLKRGAITPGFCHPALNLGPTCLTMELDEFPHIRRHTEKEGMRARNHRPVNRNSLITCRGSNALQRCSLQRFGLIRDGIPNPGENSQRFPRLLLWVVPGSTLSRKSQRDFLVASRASPVITRATAASNHSAAIVRSNPSSMASACAAKFPKKCLVVRLAESGR
jgi:hypothetical protein